VLTRLTKTAVIIPLTMLITVPEGHSMSQHLRRNALTAVCAALAVGLAGCASTGATGTSATGTKAKATPKPGLADLPAQKISDRAFAAMRSTTSMTMSLDGILDGDPGTFRMAFDTKGDCVGEMTVDGGNVKLIKHGKSVYMKYDDAFWKSQGADGKAAAEMIDGRWLKGSISDPDYKDMVSTCDLDDFLSEFESGATDAKKGPVSTVGGRTVVALIEKDSKETNTAYVATQGTPYILKIVTKGGKEPGTISFSDFNQPVHAKSPAAKDVTDLASLGN